MVPSEVVHYSSPLQLIGTLAFQVLKPKSLEASLIPLLLLHLTFMLSGSSVRKALPSKYVSTSHILHNSQASLNHLTSYMGYYNRPHWSPWFQFWPPTAYYQPSSQKV